jgi:hypothetical protein
MRQAEPALAGGLIYMALPAPGMKTAVDLDGIEYEIDLNAKHAEGLRKALSRYVEAARRSPEAVPSRIGRRWGQARDCQRSACRPGAREVVVRSHAADAGIRVETGDDRVGETAVHGGQFSSRLASVRECLDPLAG